MSRIGKKSISLPEGVSVELINTKVVVKGVKGSLELDVPDFISLKKEDKSVTILVPDDLADKNRELGLYRALIANYVKGVCEGYRKDLELVGVGYRVQLQGKDLLLALGYSHDVKFEAPKGIEFKIEGQNKIAVIGIDKCQVGQIAADIRCLREPDAYKGKGVRYAGEYIKTKPGKSVKK